MDIDDVKKVHTFVDSKEDGAERRLIQLGYKQELKRNLSLFGNAVMALSNVAPVMACFVFAQASYATVGAATAPAAVLQGINVIFIGLILGELGSVYPVSGGLYSIVNNILSRPVALVAFISFMLQGFLYPPSMALGVGQYIQILFPQLPQDAFACNIIAALAVILALIIGLSSVASNNRVAKILLGAQMLILLAFLYVCFANPQRSLGEVIFNSQMLNSSGDGITDADFGTILMGVGILCSTIEGYGASLGFSEETKGSCRKIGMAVFISAVATSVILVTVIVMSVVSAPDLRIFIMSEVPPLYTAQAYFGPIATAVINLGIIIGTFGALVVMTSYMSRVMFTSARDGIWPEKLNKVLIKVSKKSQIPWVTTLIIAIGAVIQIFTSNIVSLLTLAGMSAAMVYFLVAVGSIRSRLKNREIARPFKMPLFPLPAVIVIVFMSVAFISQKSSDLMVLGVIYVLMVAYYYIYLRPKEVIR